MKNIRRFCVLAALALAAAGCAGNPQYSALPAETGKNLTLNDQGQKPLQCVPYAREHSTVKLFGDAYTWWDQAAGKFVRASRPQVGAVLALSDYAGPQRGHVAVVRQIVSAREIRIDHSNWLDDGSIYVNDPVVDVSADNDWSQVKVWNIRTGGWGSHIYPVQGFIGPKADTDGMLARVF